LWRTFGCEGEIFCLERSIGFEADDIASIAQIEHGTSSRTDGTTFQAIPIEIYRTKMLAIAAVLPLKLNRSFGLTFQIQLAQ